MGFTIGKAMLQRIKRNFISKSMTMSYSHFPIYSEHIEIFSRCTGDLVKGNLFRCHITCSLLLSRHRNLKHITHIQKNIMSAALRIREIPDPFVISILLSPCIGCLQLTVACACHENIIVSSENKANSDLPAELVHAHNSKLQQVLIR